jgi:nucleotide-binding universal stress UspA family protein
VIYGLKSIELIGMRGGKMATLKLLEVGLPFRICDNTPPHQGKAYLAYLHEILANLASCIRSVHKPLLILRNPRWPIKQILFVLRGDQRDMPALEWTLQLACASQAAVTVLVVHPDIPAFYTRFPGVQLDLAMLLKLDEGVGILLRQALHMLKTKGVECQLRMHRAAPDEQIRMEVERRGCDLVVISEEGHGRLWRWYFGEINGPLLRWIDRPTLIV